MFCNIAGAVLGYTENPLYRGALEMKKKKLVKKLGKVKKQLRKIKSKLEAMTSQIAEKDVSKTVAQPEKPSKAPAAAAKADGNGKTVVPANCK